MVRPNAPAAILSSIESVIRVPSKPSIVFSAHKPSTVSLTIPLGNQVFLVLISSNVIDRVPECKHNQMGGWDGPFKGAVSATPLFMFTSGDTVN